MTDDIVKRLREGTFGSDETKTDCVLNAYMRKAADEIERLRDELAAERERASIITQAAQETTNLLRKRVAKLREALEQIATHDDVDLALDPQWPKRRARAVLAETGGGDEI